MAGEDAFGTTLERFSGTAFVAIASITSLSGPGLSRDTIDMTAHDSPGQWEEHLGGIKRSGELTAEINRRPDIHDVLTADFDDDEPRSYRMSWPSGAVWTFDAILTGYEPDSPHDDKLSATVTWKLTGVPDTGIGS